MRIPAFVVGLGALAATAGATQPDSHRLGELLVAKLHARHAVRSDAPTPANIDDTDFAGSNLGCITLRRSEMRGLGYPGHAFLCEEAASGTGEVLGAVLDRRGRVICHITGNAAGDACYALTICDYSDTLCVR